MASINTSSILEKAKQYMQKSSIQRDIEEIVDRKMVSDNDRGPVHSASIHSPIEAAEKFIEVLQNEIRGLGVNGGDFAAGMLGPTAVSALTKLEHSAPVKIGKYKYRIDVFFAGDLHRESLAPDKYDGVDNIAVLLNYGYGARHSVYGVWIGHGSPRIQSLQSRCGAYFIESAVANFMQEYASGYGVSRIDVISGY